MSSVIDSLVVKLGLDPKEFNEGQKKAAAAWLRTRDEQTKSAKEMEARAKAVAQGISKIRNEVLALGAALVGVGGIEQFVRKITTADAATGRLAKNLNMSASDLSAWQGVAERVGGSAEGMSASLQNLADQMQLLQLTGDASAVPWLRALNQQLGVAQISFTDASGAARPLTEVMKDIIASLNHLQKTDPQKASLIARQLGIDPALISMSREELNRMLESQRRLADLTKADVDAAQKLQAAWHDLSRVVTDQLRKALTELTPVLSGLMIDFSKFIADNKEEIGQGVRDFGNWLRSVDWSRVEAQMHDFARGAHDVTEAVGGITRASEILIALWLGSKVARMISFMMGAGRMVGAGVGFLGGAAAVGGFALGMEPSPTNQGEREGLQQTKTSYKESYDHFRKLGWSDAAAHGLAAAIVRESGGDPSLDARRTTGEDAYGLAQWHKDRRAAFERWAGHSIYGSTAEEQRRFMDYELRQGNEQRAGRMLMDPSLSRSRAAEVVDEEYERSAAGQAAKARRQGADPGLAAAMTPYGARGAADRSVTNQSSEITVGTININGVDTNSVDANARGIRKAMDRYLPVMPEFNTGLQ